jgi:uncharacterized protein (DUF1330 family)
MIFIREGAIVDHEAMAAYQTFDGDPGAAFSAMKPLAAYGELETLEGEAADGVVVLEFPDRESAKAWYFSPEYQAKVNLRLKAAPYRCFMVEGLTRRGS